ncbi:hypothetical protein B0J13DRAFT_285591 [Dactylonectria estremocensis]|uniref:Uncharacterized protein n=1 Tax=Dactylonectria estremocensis TaxID=1079267 RepID=A0A9P9F351_9HYPO|nr:hypothetical protein B0J13DRAFT_285591 [Dactylonectria estremocensis]
MPTPWQFRVVAAGHGDTTSLRRALTQNKPPIQSYVTSTKNSINKDWPELPEGVTWWHDFNLANLNESYGHVLDIEVAADRLQVPHPDKELANVTIDKSESVDRLFAWNDGVMQPTLGFAKSFLGLYAGTALLHSCFDEQTTSLKICSGDKSRIVTVGHIIELDVVPRAKLVVGFGRPSSKWSSTKLPNQIDRATKTILWPLRQLANMCRAAETCYGYMQTEDEMVVCCFSGHGEEWTAAIMPIPWSRHGTDKLTTDLALWWLFMLAMGDPNRRALVNANESIRINAWDIINTGEEGGWVRRHRYSGFEEYTNPPPGDMAAHLDAEGFSFEAFANVPIRGSADFNVNNADLVNDCVIIDGPNFHAGSG